MCAMCISAYSSAKKKTAMAAVIFIMIRVNCQGPLLVWNRLINSSSSSKLRCQARRCSASSRQKSTRSFVLRWSTLSLKLRQSRKNDFVRLKIEKKPLYMKIAFAMFEHQRHIDTYKVPNSTKMRRNQSYNTLDAINICQIHTVFDI